VKQLRATGFLAGDERVALFITGTGLKYDPPIEDISRRPEGRTTGPGIGLEDDPPIPAR
jgi:hypothetical protein